MTVWIGTIQLITFFGFGMLSGVIIDKIGYRLSSILGKNHNRLQVTEN